MRSFRMWVAAVCVVTAGGCGGSGDDGGSDGGTSVLGVNRYLCPADKPQKVYGYAVNAKSTLDQDETWTPDNVYVVVGPFHVPTSLTIQAGTVVCFDYGPPNTEDHPAPPPGEMLIESGGALKVVGTSGQHVVFTQLTDDPHQYYKGITFRSGANLANTTMQYLDVYNAGISAGGPALSTFNDYSQPPLDMQNVTFYSLQRGGLENLTSGFTAASRIVINNYAAETEVSKLFGYHALRVHVYGASTVTEKTLHFGPDVPAPVRHVQLDHAEGANLDRSVTLHKLEEGTAWRNIQNMKMNGTAENPAVLTLDPGVRLMVNNAGYIKIGDGGSGMADLVAAGTQELPIVITSDAPSLGMSSAPGDWPGILFSPGNFRADVSKFSYVTFEYGGGLGTATIYNCNDQVSDVGAEVLFNRSSTGLDYDGPSITHSTFRASAAMGVRFACNVGHTGGCLNTDYTAVQYSNTFEGFSEYPAENPLTCP